jgi:hypothetical protein
MHQLETGHPKRLVEEAHHRMLTRTPIRHGAALAVVHHARTEPTHHKSLQQAVEVGSNDDPDLTVRLRPGALLSSDGFGSRVERDGGGHPLWREVWNG